MTYKELKNYQDELIEKHLNGSTIQELSKEYQSKKKDIYDIVQFAYKHKVSQMSDLEIETAKQMYAQGMSSIAVAEQLHIHHQTILKCVDHVRSKGYRTYTLDEDYFDVIDTSNKAYILGLLYADGCNHVDQHSISISLQEGDVKILQRISDELKSNKPLEFLPPRYHSINGRECNCQPQYRLRVNSAHLSDRLNELGLVKRKTLVLEFPTFLDENLVPHFIRGYMDGDGGIYAYNRKHMESLHHQVVITQTKKFCEQLKEIVENIFNIHCGLYDAPSKSGNIKYFYIGGINQCTKFLDWIYKDADLLLDRKYETYLTYFKC